MFWDRFYQLCIKHGTKPNPVAKDLGISSGVLTKWKSGGIPNGETLSKIADYLDVSVDYLLGRDSFSIDHQVPQNAAVQNTGNLYVLSLKEHKIIEAYRNKPEMQPAVDRLLNVDD